MKVSLGQHPQMDKDLDRLQNIYEGLGVEVVRLKSATADSVFHRDVVAWTPFGLIQCQMGKLSRAWEPEHYFKELDLKPVLEVKLPGTFEGADLLWLNPTTAVLAIGSRTNPMGVTQVKNFLEQGGVHVVEVTLPDWHDQHLLGVANVADGTLYTLPGVSTGGLAFAWRLPMPEYVSKGPNWVQAGNTVVSPQNRSTVAVLRSSGCKVVEVPVPNLLREKGGVACATGVLEMH